MTMPDLEDVIEEVAEGPAAASGEGQSYTAQSIPDLIKADQYLESKQAAAQPHFGLRMAKLVPPGTV